MLEGEPDGSFPLLCARLLDAPADLPRVITPAALDAPGYDAEGLLTDLDDLPHPAWDTLSASAYPYLSLCSAVAAVRHPAGGVLMWWPKGDATGRVRPKTC